MTNNYHPIEHRHRLEKIDRKYPYTCNGCKMEGIGKRYVCTKRCGYVLHLECRYAPINIKFRGRRCRFHRGPRWCGSKCPRDNYCTECRSCDACGKTIQGFVYSSETGLDFHPRCTTLRSKISVNGVTFLLEKQGPSRCAWCNKRRLEGAAKSITGWSYVSDDCSFHVYCVMEMTMVMIESSSTSSKVINNAIVKGNSSNNPLMAFFQGMKLSKSGGAISTDKLMTYLKIFKVIVSLIFGDPTGIIHAFI